MWGQFGMLNALPPHNIEAEQAVLGSILIDPDAIFWVMDALQASDFYLMKHQHIYKAILKLNQTDCQVDFITLTSALGDAGQMDEIGEGYIIQLINAVPTSINADMYAKIVHQDALRRRTIQAASKIANLGYSTEGDIMSQLDEAETIIMDVRKEDVGTGIEMPEAYISKHYDMLVSIEDGKMVGLPSGFYDIDHMFNGFQKPHQYVVGGRPGMGKSLWATNVADYLSKLGYRVLFFSLEMSIKQITNRRLSTITGIDSRAIDRYYNLSDGQKRQINTALGELSERPFYIDATPQLISGDN